MLQCHLLLTASICLSLVIGSSGQAATAVAGAAGAAGAASDAGSPVIALIIDAVRVLRTSLKAVKRFYEAVSPELQVLRCLRKAFFTRVTPPYLKPPWPTEGWAALTRRKRSFGGPPPPQRPFLVINGPLAPASPPKLSDVVEEYLIEAWGDPSLVEAWRDFKSSWFAVVSARTSKCARKYTGTRFWRWVDGAA